MSNYRSKRLAAMLQGLKDKISELVSLYEKEKRRGDELEAQLRRSEEDVKACKEQIDDLTRQIDNLRLSSAFAQGNSTPEARRRLDKVIAGIDKCIELLEN